LGACPVSAFVARQFASSPVRHLTLGGTWVGPRPFVHGQTPGGRLGVSPDAGWPICDDVPLASRLDVVNH
jgi:hypothetical protein